MKQFNHVQNVRERSFHRQFYAANWGRGQSFKMFTKDAMTWQYECPTVQREFRRWREDKINASIVVRNIECDNSAWERHLDVDPDAPEVSESWEDGEYV